MQLADIVLMDAAFLILSQQWKQYDAKPGLTLRQDAWSPAWL
jgi:hypothetical protein